MLSAKKGAANYHPFKKLFIPPNETLSAKNTTRGKQLNYATEREKGSRKNTREREREEKTSIQWPREKREGIYSEGEKESWPAPAGKRVFPAVNF